MRDVSNHVFAIGLLSQIKIFRYMRKGRCDRKCVLSLIPAKRHNDRMKPEKLDQLRKQFMAGIWIGAGLLVFGLFEGVPVFWVLGLILLGVSSFRLKKLSRVAPQDDEKT